MPLSSTGASRVWSGRGLLQATLAAALLLSAALSADEPEALRARIDRAVESGPVAAVADDSAFLRRIHLDLTGRIPSADEARAFLDEASPDKRAKAVDRLLAGPEFARHMAVTFDVWLMERRSDKHVKTDEWRAWLLAFFQAKRPYNELPRDLFVSDGSEPLLRPAARFMLDREVSPDALTRDVGRVFFGMDLECAQCHDHPRVADYLQKDYYGIYAFVNRVYLFQPDAKKPAVVAEKGEGDAAFKSVFTKAEGTARPKLPEGAPIQEPAFAKGEEYQVKPDPKNKALRPIPKYSRRSELARLLGEGGGGRAFDRNIANRLWAHMMGRGLVEPLDFHHSDNPPAYPELLEELARGIAAMKYDVRAFLRELALSRTYQRSARMPAELGEPAAKAAAARPALEAEAATRKAAAEKAEEAAGAAAEAHDAARKALATAAGELAKAEAARAEAAKAQDAAQKDLDAREDLRKTVAEAAEKASDPRLASDPELAAAAATFRARAEKLAKETAALVQDFRSKAMSAVALKKLAETAQVKRDELDRQVSARALELETAEAARRAAKTASLGAARRAADAKALAEAGSLLASAARSREELRQLKAELAAAREALAKGPADLAAREAKAAEARKADESARRDLAAREEALGPAREAAAKAEEAAKKAGKDAELAGAAAKVKARADALAAEAEGLRVAARKAAAEREAAERAHADLASAKERVPALEAKLKASAARAAQEETRRDESLAKLTELWTRRFAVAGLDPLSPEQICWSMMQATGVVDQQRAAARAEAEKKKVPEAEAARFVEQLVYDKLKANEAAFVKAFGGGPGQPQDEFYATVDQALFLANGAQVRGWLAPSAGNLAERLMKLEDPKALARELYLAALGRAPSDAEVADVVRYVESRPKAKLAAVQELIWATLTSVEFRFKH